MTTTPSNFRIVSVHPGTARSRGTEIVTESEKKWDVLPRTTVWESLLFCHQCGANAILFHEGAENAQSADKTDLSFLDFDCGRYYISGQMPLPVIICDAPPEGATIAFVHYLKQNRMVAQLRKLLTEISEELTSPGKDPFLYLTMQRDSQKDSKDDFVSLVGDRFINILGTGKLAHIVVPALVRRKKFQAAELAIERALFQSPQDPFVKLTGAAYYYAAKKTELARELLEEVATDKDLHPLFVYFSFEKSLQAFDLPMARMLLDFLMTRFADAEVSQVAYAQYLCVIKKRKAAARLLLHCFEKSPQNLVVSSLLYQTLLEINKPNLAAALQGMALNTVSANVETLSSLHIELMTRKIPKAS